MEQEHHTFRLQYRYLRDCLDLRPNLELPGVGWWWTRQHYGQMLRWVVRLVGVAKMLRNSIDQQMTEFAHAVAVAAAAVVGTVHKQSLNEWGTGCFLLSLYQHPKLAAVHLIRMATAEFGDVSMMKVACLSPAAAMRSVAVAPVPCVACLVPPSVIVQTAVLGSACSGYWQLEEKADWVGGWGPLHRFGLRSGEFEQRVGQQVGQVVERCQWVPCLRIAPHDCSCVAWWIHGYCIAAGWLRGIPCPEGNQKVCRQYPQPLVHDWGVA